MVLWNGICGMTYKTRNAELSQKYRFTHNNNDIRIQTKIREKVLVITTRIQTKNT